MGNCCCPLLTCGMCYSGEGGLRCLCSYDRYYGKIKFANFQFDAFDWYDRAFRFRVYLRCKIDKSMHVYDRNTLQLSYKIFGPQYYKFIVHDFENKRLVLFEERIPIFTIEKRNNSAYVYKYTANQEGSNVPIVSDDMIDSMDYGHFCACT
jgi:hypothetical protein